MSETESNQIVPSKTPKEQSRRFGTIVLALWPIKPALNLAQRINASERAANLYINGKRKITARCVQVIVNEILE